VTKVSSFFWERLETLIASSEIVIDRPRGSSHPRYPAIVYPLDYGYLRGTSSGDGDGIDVWRGSLPNAELDAAVCTVDVMKRDAEIKLLIGCTETEKQIVLDFLNSEYMSAVLIERDRI
jgi:inorganic pyrophosphatase